MTHHHHLPRAPSPPSSGDNQVRRNVAVPPAARAPPVLTLFPVSWPKEPPFPHPSGKRPQPYLGFSHRIVTLYWCTGCVLGRPQPPQPPTSAPHTIQPGGADPHGTAFGALAVGCCGLVRDCMEPRRVPNDPSPIENPPSPQILTSGPVTPPPPPPHSLSRPTH